MSWRPRWGQVPVIVLMLALQSCTPHPPDAANPAVGAGLTRHVGPSSQACAGVRIAPGDDVQAAIDAHPANKTFCFSAGIYRLETPLAPQSGDTLIGETGAVLSGSKVLSGWRADGSVWTAAGFLPSGAEDRENCLDSAPLCQQAEDVFFDKRRLRPVESASEVIAGTVYVDYAADTITIGDDPSSHLVEQAVSPGIVQATVRDVTIANFVIEEAANEAQVGAIDSRRDNPDASGSGWRILDNEVRLNHGVGVGVASTSVVSGNLIHDQGQLGIGAWGADSVIADNEIAHNGTAGYDPEWEAGGAKSWMTERLTLSHNDVHDNLGPGLWSDGGNSDTTYSYNKITANWNAGIQYEISYDAVIEHNQISGNGLRHKGWAWDAGIQIQSSGGNRSLEIAYNTVSNNANGISLIDSGNRADEEPAPHGQHTVHNVWVHDNVVSMASGQSTGAVEDSGDPAIFTANDNRFEGNVYLLPSLTDPYFAWDGLDVDWSRWRHLGAGNDVTGRAELFGG